jgi:putative membrane protein
MKRIAPAHVFLLFCVLVVFLWSAYYPYDRLTWWLEVSPGLIGLAILAATYRRFRFTTLCYTLIALHICILCVGGHYTYERVPLFNWLRPVFGWHRNHFDRLGHFAQGFVPATIARELFIRLKVLHRPRWMPFLILSICLAISAFYELIEWWTALVGGNASSAFLGTQGDIWDTQEDMLFALIGATCALIFIGRWHDRQLAAQLEQPANAA